MGEIGISILDSEITNIKSVLAEIRSLSLKSIHIDVLDTSFTDNISFGPSIVNQILACDSGFDFNVHLMVSSPIPIFDALDSKRISRVIIHAEIPNLGKALAHIGTESSVGIALSPGTGVEAIRGFDVDFVLVMGVKPGRGGQEFLSNTPEKVRRLKEMGLKVGVDGGVSLRTVQDIKHADYFVVGSAYFNSRDKKSFLETFMSEIGE